MSRGESEMLLQHDRGIAKDQDSAAQSMAAVDVAGEGLSVVCVCHAACNGYKSAV